MSAPRHSGSTIVPCLRYRDCTAAIGWLCRVFGFQERLVVPGPGGTIAHAELVTTEGAEPRGMVMLGSTKTSEYDALMKHPDEIGGFETQSAYLVVPDADAVHDRAVQAGAEIVIAIHDEEYGGRGFGCRDLEGRLWYVGTYDPWSATTQSMSTQVSVRV
jgi:uncharacterized glyoxalase superfamily protein PhnB